MGFDANVTGNSGVAIGPDTEVKNSLLAVFHLFNNTQQHDLFFACPTTQAGAMGVAIGESGASGSGVGMGLYHMMHGQERMVDLVSVVFLIPPPRFALRM